LGEKPNRLIFSGKANTLTPEEDIIKSKKPLPARINVQPIVLTLAALAFVARVIFPAGGR